jgi:hypothetical protein
MEEDKIKVITMLESLKALILADNFINHRVLNGQDFNNLLDLRDESNFEVEWLRVSDEMEEKQKVQEIVSDMKELIETIRELAFKRTYSLTQNSEIAEYVSDDFDLIATALALDYKDNWLNALMLLYQNGQFPFPCSKS